VPDQRILIVAGPNDTAAEPAPGENLASQHLVMTNYLVDAHSKCERSGDNGAGRSSSNKVKIVAQAKFRFAVALLQNLFDSLQETQRQDASQATSVEGQDALRPRSLKVLVSGEYLVVHAASLFNTLKAFADSSQAILYILPLGLFHSELQICEGRVELPGGSALPFYLIGQFRGLLHVGRTEGRAQQSRPELFVLFAALQGSGAGGDHEVINDQGACEITVLTAGTKQLWQIARTVVKIIVKLHSARVVIDGLVLVALLVTRSCLFSAIGSLFLRFSPKPLVTAPDDPLALG